KGARRRPWQATEASVALAGEDQQQIEDVDEDVVNVQEQRQRRHDVVGLAAADDRADVVQQISREDQHGNRRNRHRQRRDMQEQVRQRRDDQQHQPDQQELAQEAEVALRNRGYRRHDEEDRRGHAAGQRDQLPAIPHLRGELQYRRQHYARHEREAEYREHAPAAVAQRRDDEQHAEHRAEHQQRRPDGRSLEQAGEVDRRAEPCSGDRRQHRQREQPVGVAQNALLLVARDDRRTGLGRWRRLPPGRLGAIDPNGFQLRFHHLSFSRVTDFRHVALD